MRELLLTVDPSVWSEISAGFFGMCFIALVSWVFWPTRRQAYERHAALPLELESSDGVIE